MTFGAFAMTFCERQMISKIRTHLEIGFDSVCYDVLPNCHCKPKHHRKPSRTMTIEHDPEVQLLVQCQQKDLKTHIVDAPLTVANPLKQSMTNDSNPGLPPDAEAHRGAAFHLQVLRQGFRPQVLPQGGTEPSSSASHKSKSNSAILFLLWFQSYSTNQSLHG